MKHFVRHLWLFTGLLLVLATAGCFRSAGGADEPPLSSDATTDSASTAVAIVASETPTETIIEFTPEFTSVVEATDPGFLVLTETPTEIALIPASETPTTDVFPTVEPATQVVALGLTETPTQVVIVLPTETPTEAPTLTPEIFFAPTATATDALAALLTPTPEQDFIFPTPTPTSFLAPTATEANSGLPALQESTPNQSQIDATNIIASATQVFINQTLTAQAVFVPTIPPFTPTIDPTFLPQPGIVTATPGPVLSGADCVHEVVLGENLFRLSLRYGVGVADIARSSGITNINLIFVGQKLVIPGCGTTGVVPPATSIPSGVLGTGGPLSDTATGTGGGRIHTVQQYETLFQISLIYSVPINSIVSANGISNINLIYIGQELVIP
ncbi:MAG: LysM peptidoglycan-binding domain-containing protein [Chitinophagaceae bacterium]|nr:LysM peptidoglycan-binding domain-containing protein [Anaerolineae bacterium]